jgi:lipopolysaccharide biosynthesis glycosyltransferase
MADALKVYVGYDSREDIAWQVCRHSLNRVSSDDVIVYPLRQPTLRELGLYSRPADPGASTEFSLTRFLTPYVAAHEGWSIFVDCDFVFTRSPEELISSLSTEKGIYVVKHDYSPAMSIKMDGKVQSVYPRKNWSSFMVFNGKHPAVKSLTPALVNKESSAFLHRFEWIDDEDIGSLDLTWNFLEGEYPPPEEIPSAIHFTNGGPWFENWKNVMFADVWRRECELYLADSGRQAG